MRPKLFITDNSNFGEGISFVRDNNVCRANKGLTCCLLVEIKRLV